MFLYRSLHNALVDHYKTAGRETELPGEESGTVAPFEESKITFEIDRALSAKEVREALEQIPPSYKTILLMRYMDELEIDEIAAALDKTKNAVYVMLHRAVKELKRIIVKTTDGNQNYG